MSEEKIIGEEYECEHCGKTYVAKRKNQRFCCSRCSNDWKYYHQDNVNNYVDNVLYRYKKNPYKEKLSFK